MTASALFFYAIGIIGFGLRDILSRVFYSIQDTKTPMINGAIAMILNIILNIILVKYMKHSGLALATSISSIICIILLFISLSKKIGYFGQDKIISVLIKSVISALFMGVGTKFSYNFINSLMGTSFIEQAISLGSSIVVGKAIYFICILILKVDEVTYIIELIKSRLNKGESFREVI